MSAPVPGARESWSSRLTFVMASVGFAVGLGNIWRFPYVAGENGGGAFVLLYLLFVLIIGAPLVMAEWTIGRSGHGAVSASGSIRSLARASGAASAWAGVGGIAVAAVFMLMLFYTTVAGWTMDYFVRAAAGELDGVTAEGSDALFDGLMADPARLILWHTAVVALTVHINSRGLRAGIERAVNILMPALFASMVLMVGYAAAVGDFGGAARFLLAPDFSRVTGETLLMALGQAFFSIGIAMGVMITYGSYLDRKTSIPRNAFVVVGADTLVALLAGFAIFPLVFAHGLAPGSGEGLVFRTLPIAFGGLPGGRLFGGVFFFLLFAAAITSCISNFAPVVAWIEERFRMGRARAALAGGAALWTLGLGTVFSFNLLSGFYPLDFIGVFAERTIYSVLDFTMSAILLPVGAFLTAVFLGWFVPADAMRDGAGLRGAAAFRLWRFLLRFVVPPAVALIFVGGLAGWGG